MVSPAVNGFVPNQGLAPTNDPRQAFVDQYRPENLQRRIQLRDQTLQPLYTRMDQDYNLWRLTPFTGIDSDIYDSKDFLHYTSNEPRTFANKVTNWYNQATLIIRIEQEGRNEGLRRVDSMKERLAYGFLEAADKKLRRMGLPAFREQSSFQICIRGPVFARVLLRLDRNTGQTVVDITPWDSRNVIWDSGPEGLAWCAFKIRKTRDQIFREYGVQVDGAGTGDFNAQDQEGILTYDFYDSRVNAVFTENLQMLKPPQLHMRPRMPIAYSFGGYAPLMSNSIGSDASGGQNDIRDFSESIYESNREVYQWDNYQRSINLHLSAEAREPIKILRSRDGSMVLDSDANIPGAEIPLSTTNDENIEYLPPVELTQTAVNMLGLTQAQVQQGSLSPVNFGNAPFSLSGFAINSLSISAEEKIQPRVRQGEDLYLMALEILMEQYATGMFPTLTVTGRARDGAGFSEPIPAQVVQIGGELTVELIPNLPTDELQKIQQAQLMRQPGPNGQPLLDDKYIRDHTLAIRDGDNMEDRLKAQVAERGSPLAQMWSNIQAAMNQGDRELAFLYGQEMQYLLFQMWASAQGLLPPPQIPPTGPPELGSPAFNAQASVPSPTVPSNVSPPQAIGRGNGPANQAGPNVPPGSPRPGAQVQTQQLFPGG